MLLFLYILFKKFKSCLLYTSIEGKKLYAASSPQAQIYNVDIRSADFYEQIAARKAGRKPVREYTRQQIVK